MASALTKDILRTIRKERKRLIALIGITALGVTMITGLRASCENLRISADMLFDDRQLHDLSIVSTLGLTDEDIDALMGVSGVEYAEGMYTEAVKVDTNDSRSGAIINTFTKNGIDTPLATEGRLPRTEYEIAVTSAYLKDTGKEIGDTVTIYEDLAYKEIVSEETGETVTVPDTDNEELKQNFINTEFIITGVVTDVTSVVNPEGSTAAFRSSASEYYPMFVLMKALDTDIYTSVNILVEGAAELNTFSDDYKDLVESVREEIEHTIKQDREEARTKAILTIAENKIEEAQTEIDEQFADADEQLEDARDTLDLGWGMMYDGIAELNTNEAQAAQQFAAARAQIRDGYAELDAGKAQLDAAQAELDAGRAQMEASLTPLRNAAAEAENALAALDGESSIYSVALVFARDELYAQITQIESEYGSQLSAGQQQIDEQRAQLEAGYSQLAAAEAELKAQEDNAYAQIEWARIQIEESRSQLLSGEKDYSAGVEEVTEQRQQATDKIEESKEALKDLDTATWYVRDRSNLTGWADIKADADCIQSIGTIFPVLFFVIAILISLTTITRMVEENRGLIGTYQALGFHGKEIRRKYTMYSFTACVVGGILGNIAGFVILPEILFIIFREMYLIPSFVLSFNPITGFGGMLLFALGIVTTTVISCSAELKHMPAALMRPKAPGNGSRIFLEYITPLWRSMNFLSKVTARNLFRYKKRLIMTVLGIAGCTGLLLCGFTIKDTVADLMPRQYEDIFCYDILAVTAGGEDNLRMKEYLEDRNQIQDYINIRLEQVEVEYEDETISLQMYVFPAGKATDGYFNLYTESGKAVELKNRGFYITGNAAKMLGFSEGDEISVQTIQLDVATGNVQRILMNYLGNSLYISEEYYTKLFGEFEPNAALINLADDSAVYDETENIIALEGVMSVTSIQEQKDGFGDAFALMNMVVYVVIILAGALAFVVLFTLSTTNISERERELATIKVLGFYDKEVHRYVNKESLILTVIGIILGMPLGSLFGQLLMNALELPSINFIITLHNISYLYAAVTSLIFALAVELMTNRILNKIDPIEALKSVE